MGRYQYRRSPIIPSQRKDGLEYLILSSTQKAPDIEVALAAEDLEVKKTENKTLGMVQSNSQRGIIALLLVKFSALKCATCHCLEKNSTVYRKNFLTGERVKIRTPVMLDFFFVTG